jgi:hypothetical protein
MEWHRALFVLTALLCFWTGKSAVCGVPAFVGVPALELRTGLCRLQVTSVAVTVLCQTRDLSL